MSSAQILGSGGVLLCEEVSGKASFRARALHSCELGLLTLLLLGSSGAVLRGGELEGFLFLALAGLRVLTGGPHASVHASHIFKIFGQLVVEPAFVVDVMSDALARSAPTEVELLGENFSKHLAVLFEGWLAPNIVFLEERLPLDKKCLRLFERASFLLGNGEGHLEGRRFALLRL